MEIRTPRSLEPKAGKQKQLQKTNNNLRMKDQSIYKFTKINS
jgi:hypothetical protein